MDATRKPVLYFTRFVPAYRIPILNRFNEALGGNLVVCAGQPPGKSSVLKADKDQAQEFERIDLQNHWFRGYTLHFQNFSKAFKKYPNPSAIIAEESPRSIMLPFLLREAKRRGAGRALWGIFYSVHRPFSARHPLQTYRVRMARSVEACACYTKSVSEVLKPHIDNSKLFVAQNTLETDVLFEHQEQLSIEGRPQVRQRLGINPEHKVIIFVGQLIPRKGTRELLQVFQRIQKETPTTLLVMGGGPDRSDMEKYVREQKLENVQFLGPIAKLEDSSPYIFASDVALIPGYVGLVANHALCLGVPVVTQKAPGDSPFHGPEVESIVDGLNGSITTRNNSDLAQGVLSVFADQETYSRNSLLYAKEHITSQRMVQGLVDAVRHAEQAVANHE